MAIGKKIPGLVVGARGLLGRELMKVLPSRDEVTGVDREDCDILDPGRIEAVLDSVHPVWVVNAAAYTDVDGCEKNRELAQAVNVTGPGNLARACHRRGIYLVQLSTDFVFDGHRNSPYREDDRPHPLSVYGRTKLEGEKAVLREMKDALVVRTSWLFGSGGRNFPDTILKKAASADKISVVADQVGSPTAALDLAEGIRNLIGKKAVGIVHVTNRGSCSWFDYALFVVREAGLTTRVIPVKSSEFPRPAARPAYSVLDHRRYEEITGRTMRPWQEAVREFLSSK